MSHPSPSPFDLALTRKSDRRTGALLRPSASSVLWAVPLAAALVIGGAAFFGNRALERRIEAEVASELEALRDGTVLSLREWADSESNLARLIADRRSVRDAAPSLLSAIMNDEPSPVAEALGRDLSEALALAGFDAVAIVASTGKIVTRSPGFAFENMLDPQQLALFAPVFEGATKLLVSKTNGGSHEPRRPVILVATPIAMSSGRRIAALALQGSPERDFTRLTAVARVGRTGENYVFDRNGTILSRSRFEDQLRAAGMIGPDEPSSGNVEARDPGVNVAEGGRPSTPPRARPFSWSVAHILEKEADVSTTPYPDYRGVPVLGAYRWLPDLELGVVSKMDADEAFETLVYMKAAFWSVFGALLAAAFLLTLGSFLKGRTRRKADALRTVGSYTLIERIGEGAMGKVYRAKHAVLRRPAAVKILEERSSESIQRFEREAQLTSQLSHRNTVSVYDFGKTPDGSFFYVMELLEGIGLDRLLAAVGPLPPSRVVSILRQICWSLGEAHGLGLVHRDIKPSNVVLVVRGGEADVVKVIDFGLAKPMERAASTLTRAGTIYGTPGFIPPETLRDPTHFDARGDLYALGAVAYELLAGVPPFDRTSTLELWHLHSEVDPPPPSVRLGSPLPADLEDLVMRLLAKDPDHRPESAVAVIDQLDRLDVRPWPQAAARAWWASTGVELLHGSPVMSTPPDPEKPPAADLDRTAKDLQPPESRPNPVRAGPGPGLEG